MIELPRIDFYLFGMGDRRKLIYRDGCLSDVFTGQALGRWDVARAEIDWNNYQVLIETRDGQSVVIYEDEQAVWLAQAGQATPLTQSHLTLPEFDGHPHQFLMKTLHQEVLINLLPQGPVPNLFVYPRPWYRDGAMACMVLKATGNLHLVRNWILSLREPFDRNNGCCESDNLGQALYMISLVADRSHPLVDRVIGAAGEFRRGNAITGQTDGRAHAVYQTKWMKFGLNCLGLDDPYEIPAEPDDYSELFWWDYTDQHVATGQSTGVCWEYPYLTWASAHFHHAPPPIELCGRRYPLSWEACASQADHSKLAAFLPEHAAIRLATPHIWHAAEMFLMLK